MLAGQICSRVVATASPGETVGAAARRMAEYDVGTVIVIEGNRFSKAVGILTDRDIAIRCVAEKYDPETTSVSLIMSTPAHAVDERTPVEDAIAKMAAAGTRRLVVTADGDRIAGILSLDDAVDTFIRQADAVSKLLEKQQPHVPV
jgi:CBS domain-containing protein